VRRSASASRPPLRVRQREELGGISSSRGEIRGGPARTWGSLGPWGSCQIGCPFSSSVGGDGRRRAREGRGEAAASMRGEDPRWPSLAAHVRRR
jgi:hypothetical protein